MSIRFYGVSVKDFNDALEEAGFFDNSSYKPYVADDRGAIWVDEYDSETVKIALDNADIPYYTD